MRAKLDKQRTLENLIRDKGIVVEDKPFTLSSGKTSQYYYDLKQAILTPEGLNLVRDLGLVIVKGLKAKSVGGLESGSIPFATTISARSHGTANPMQSFFVRKQAKEHGRRKWIEGNIESPAVIVDDVITTGKSALDAVKKLEETDCKVIAVVAIVDREEGANQLFAKEGLRLYSMFSHSRNFKAFIDKQIASKQNKEIYQPA